jgi:3-methyl-2-oxobutanoate hydroxymethyltransferase
MKPQSSRKLESLRLCLRWFQHQLQPPSQKQLSIPTIGIGAGNQTDGQILVWQDFAGLSTGSRKFVKQYASLRNDLTAAAKAYRADVQSSSFPSKDQSFED